jgi:hypothetical protein
LWEDQLDLRRQTADDEPTAAAGDETTQPSRGAANTGSAIGRGLDITG